ncbi:MAG: NAD(P)H-quinone oxidoreductase [Alphaproteobacteria bacterium]
MTDPLPQSMSAIEITEFGGPDVLRICQRPVPRPGTGELLVRIAAAGVNRPDVMQRQGGYAPPPGASDIPGLELAGTIVAIGSQVTGWALGEEICALVSGGGYAEYALVPAPQALPIPDGLDAVSGAALPETMFTVWSNLFDRARLAAGELVLIHGGSSGIGTTAIQLAHAFGATVVTTVGTAEKAAACLELGAALAINYRDQDFVEQVQRFTDDAGVDVILDMIGGAYLERNISLLKVEGRLAIIALMGGGHADLDLRQLLVRRLTITAATLRPRSIAQKGEIAAALRDRVWPLIAAGRVRPVIHATFPLAQAAQAHHVMEASTHIGKLVLVP